MWGLTDKREELVARFNAWLGKWGLPPLPDPEIPKKSPVPTAARSSALVATNQVPTTRCAELSLSRFIRSGA
jgi:hypothetical protein